MSRPISGFSGITADEKIDLETSDVVGGKQSDVVDDNVAASKGALEILYGT